LRATCCARFLCNAQYFALVFSLLLRHFLHESDPAAPARFSFPHFSGVLFCMRSRMTQGVILMEWTTPQHEEIDLNCEISSYANAEL
jgi:hypothetical protein